MENELNKMMEESQRFQNDWDDDDDMKSSLDIDEFERRIKTGNSFFQEDRRGVQSAKQFQGPQNLQDLNSKMKQQQLKQQQRQQQQQKQIPLHVPAPDKKVKELQDQVSKLQGALTKETNLRGKLEKEVKDVQSKEVKTQKAGDRMQSYDASNRVQEDWKNKTLDRPPTKQSTLSNTKVEQLKGSLEQSKQDNELLIQKYKSLNQKKNAIEQELLEARQELDKMRKSGQQQPLTLPKIDLKSKRERLTEEQEASLLQELRLLRIENEELQRVLTSKDQARVVKDLTLQNSKLRGKIDDLTYKNK